ncbi:MAG: hypothetical protein WD468_00250 [Pirellulales bacterium]
MTRILPTIGLLSLLLMVTALAAGLSIGELHQLPVSQDTLLWASVHRLTGVAAALAVVFVECIIVTYFIGTSRWCKEVVETYQFDPELVRESNRLKRRTFPWALAGMLAVIGVSSLGAAADPTASGVLERQSWTDWHLIGALVGVVFIAWTYIVAWNHVVANQAIIERLVAQVQQVRRERGLEP